jgi:hypothetical protein
MRTQRWFELARSWWAAVVVVLVVAVGTVYGIAIALLASATVLLIAGTLVLWQSLGELGTEEALTLQEALDVAAPECQAPTGNA